jgi:hypothetical protein
MDAITLNNISCQIDIEELMEKLHVKQDREYFTRAQEMAAEAQSLAKPKAVYKEAYVDCKGDNFVVIDGVKFTSRIMRVNMEETFRAFPYVATCGTEVESWSKQYTDLLDSYFADTIKEMFLRVASREVETCIDRQYALGHAVSMNPGSLAEWPISEQKLLFGLLGKVEELIGVQLTDSFLMLPIKTVSGIRFPKEGTYENCQLCPRQKCPGRKERYDEGLYQRKYQLKQNEE